MSRAGLRRMGALFGLLLAVGAGAEPAALNVSGLGWWQDRQARFSLQRLLGEDRGAVLNANAVEDAVFLLMASLAEDGYLQPTVTARPRLTNGETPEYVFNHRLETWLPRPMAASELSLEVARGVRFRVREVEVHGNDGAITTQEVRWAFSLDPEAWFGAKHPPYRRGGAASAAGRVEEELRSRGYAEARVEVEQTAFDESDGAVALRVDLRPGQRWRVRAVQGPEAWSEGVEWTAPELAADTWWTPAWQQDIAQSVRRAHHAAGYPEAVVEVVATAEEGAGAERMIVAGVTVIPGERVRVGEVRFTGAETTRRATLNRRVAVESGDWFDPAAVDDARRRLLRLGIFQRVDLPHMDTVAGQRDVVFDLVARAKWEASLLLGYGSYEQVRGGFDLERHNLWGRAHRSRLQLIQSMKGTRGDYVYAVPELFGERVEGSVRGFGLWREEAAFDREEYGGEVTLRRPLPWFGAEGRATYAYQSLRNRDNELATRLEDAPRIIAASLEVGLARDRRDNPLRPRRGYRWYAQVEAAARYLGGQVDFQRAGFGGSYHTPWGRGRWVHLGLSHAVVLTLGADDDQDLPVNRRYYPGGENSLRGFQDGEAAPRAGDGTYLGAKTFTLLNVELEQALTQTWSGILFFDTLLQSARLSDYPGGEWRYSAGLGVRYQTLIGPVRLEYGHNLNPRPLDPRGTLHLSVGFPF